MKKILFLFIITISLLFTGCTSTETSNTTEVETKITLENYEKIEMGMTLEEVTAILGEGTEEATTENGDIKITSYRWTNEDGSNIGIMFNNNKVETKAQAALK